ncbi:pyridoxal 5'-phosphate synthase [Glaciihabitans sp. UYNi722]|uniref:pyridoxine/pyridoxamine 5'-phosphate oxidase n=1 Tax=Glaciihabitans sp. UYNi722 TaxID=3156344 RepID=UPI00339AA868
MSNNSWRDRLRALPVFGHDLPGFATDAAPADPIDLVTEWLSFAIDDGVSQPHAMTIATADADAAVSARTLILKDLTPEGLWFSTMANSQKGHDLTANPNAALLFYWREHGRQVRVSGEVSPGDRTIAEADFLQRSTEARAVAIAGLQSGVLAGLEQFDSAVADARAILDFKPDYVPDAWTAYLVKPMTMEFWQATRDRDQIRLRYTRTDGGWARELLWP